MRFLSYELSEDTPTYVGNPPVMLKQVSSIADGEAANWFSIVTINHSGTHIDAPWHFDGAGLHLEELAPESFVYTSAVLIDLPRDRDELIRSNDLELYSERLARADLVILRTGFGERYRTTDPVTYGSAGPGFEESAGQYLRGLPLLRCAMMDIISASAPAHPEAGVAFHRTALGSSVSGALNPYVLLVEDCRLDVDLTPEDLAVVIVAPLRIRPSDGGPCTVLAFSDDDLVTLRRGVSGRTEAT